MIANNLVALVRPVWSLLLVDQSPAAIWIVNPDNDVYGNVVAGSSHYGIWYRALEAPDGVSGQAQADENVAQCPNFTPLALFYGNVAHSVGRNGLKLSDYFPAVGGATCDEDTIGEPATFGDFVAWKTSRFGIWGEFLVDVSFDNVRLVDHGIAGIEFLYINGKGTHFATSFISNSLFVGEVRCGAVWFCSLLELTDSIRFDSIRFNSVSMAARHVDSDRLSPHAQRE